MVSGVEEGVNLGVLRRQWGYKPINIFVTDPVVILLALSCLGSRLYKERPPRPTFILAFFSFLSPEPLHLFSRYPTCEFPTVVSFQYSYPLSFLSHSFDTNSLPARSLQSILQVLTPLLSHLRFSFRTRIQSFRRRCQKVTDRSEVKVITASHQPARLQHNTHPYPLAPAFPARTTLPHQDPSPACLNNPTHNPHQAMRMEAQSNSLCLLNNTHRWYNHKCRSDLRVERGIRVMTRLSWLLVRRA
jgi:hypothetical protein